MTAERRWQNEVFGRKITYFLPSMIDIGKKVGATLGIINYIQLSYCFFNVCTSYSTISNYIYIHIHIQILIYLLPMVVNHPNVWGTSG